MILISNDNNTIVRDGVVYNIDRKNMKIEIVTGGERIQVLRCSNSSELNEGVSRLRNKDKRVVDFTDI